MQLSKTLTASALIIAASMLFTTGAHSGSLNHKFGLKDGECFEIGKLKICKSSIKHEDDEDDDFDNGDTGMGGDTGDMGAPDTGGMGTPDTGGMGGDTGDMGTPDTGGMGGDTGAGGNPGGDVVVMTPKPQKLSCEIWEAGQEGGGGASDPKVKFECEPLDAGKKLCCFVQYP